MRQNLRNATLLLLCTMGSMIFWGMLLEGMRPVEPHPGLRDDALKEALRKDRNHKALTYLQARKHLYGSIDGDGRRAECVYTGATIDYFKQPLPTDALIEHAWPLTRLPTEARSDLHHMYAVQAEARVARLNLHYGKVLFPVWSEGGSRSGPSAKVKPVFEVRTERRGDVARAMFYIATMHQLQIPDDEEAELRRWHEQDPVSRFETDRNQRVAKVQTSRNPFVDHPGLVKRVSNF